LSLPLFLFVAGASIVPAFNKRHAAGQTTRQVIWRIIWRTVLLCTVGIVCEDGKWLHWHDPRLVGAFQRIAVCYALAGVLKLTTRWRFQAVAVGFLLIDYWGILAFGIPGEASPYSLEGNAAAVVDQLLLPGRKYFATWDPQGILTTIPAVGVTIAGVLAGTALIPTALTPAHSLFLFGVGSAAIGAGFSCGSFVPVVPSLWTVTFCLIAIGVGLCLLSLFHVMIDVYHRAGVFVVVTILGRNSLIVVVAMSAFLRAIDLASRFAPTGLRSVLLLTSPICTLIALYLVCLLAFVLDYRKIYVTI
jgi:predicted acyltransferase